MSEDKERYAPEGKMWVCVACGKYSKYDRFNSKECPWWDESCVLNSILVDSDKVKFNEYGVVVECVAEFEEVKNDEL